MAKGKISAEPIDPQAGLTRKHSHLELAKGENRLQLADGLEARFTDDGFEINSFLAASRENILNFKYRHGGIANRYSCMNARLTIAGNPIVEISGVYSGQDLTVWLVKDGTGNVLVKSSQEHTDYTPAIERKYLSLAREAAEKAVKELQVRKVYDAFMARQESKNRTPMMTLREYIGDSGSSESGSLPLRAR